VVIEHDKPLLALGSIVKKRSLGYVSLLLIACLSGNVFAITTLKASVDRNPAMVAETFNLTIIADDNVDKNALDTRALLKHFVVGQTAISSNTQIINGAMTRQTTWRVGLMSRNAGSFVIPALKIGNVSSQSISMKIIDQPASAKSNDEIQLKTSINATTVYIGQPLVYEIKLLLGTRLQRAQLQPPNLVGAEVTQVGEDKDSSEIINGKRYRTITRQYNISPSQAGNFELEGSVFRGDISQSGYGRSKPITLLGDNHQIVVKAIPANFPGEWLVSEMVVIEDKWADEQDYQVGEPITRTLTLSAANVSMEQLPDLSVDAGSLLQSYPDKPKLQQGLSGATLISQAVQKIALIPIKSGDITVPEIKVPWFDPKSEQVKWATIPEKTINVKPATFLPNALPVVSSTIQKNSVNTPSNTMVIQDDTLLPWHIVSALLLFLLTLSSGYIIWLRQQTVFPPNRASGHVNKVSSSIYDTLLHSLTNNELSEVVRLLPLWLKQDYQMTIDDTAPNKFGVSNMYHQLTKDRFSQHTQDIDCKGLKECVIAMYNNKAHETVPLNGLYNRNHSKCRF
jgi:hypothetical protein